MRELNGYVKIHRKLIRWGWYKNSVIKDTFLHCIFMANFTDQPFEGMIIKKGQFVTSYENLADDLGFTVQKIRTAIKKLKSTGEITTQSTNKFTIITVVKWEDYQMDIQNVTNELTSISTFNQQTTNNQLTIKQQTTNNKLRMNKNDKNDKKCVWDTHTDEKQSEKIPFAEFVKMTNAEYDALIQKFGESDTKRMIEILDNHKGANGKEYESDYRAILSWVTDRLNKEKAKEPNNLHQDNHNHRELESLTRKGNRL